MPASGAPARDPDVPGVPAALGCGLLMGTADAVPGVSGGTVALILGIYERFIESLGIVLRLPVHLRRPEGRRRLAQALRLLVPLGCGVIVAFAAASRLLVGGRGDPGWLEQADTAPLCYGFFFGLVLVSVREPWRRIHRRSAVTWLLAGAGALAAFLFAGLPALKERPEAWMLLYGGALAITVMLLPGISGSLMLVLLNQYTTVLEAVHDRDLQRLGMLAAGLLGGALLFVPLLRRLLHAAYDPTMAVLTGLMAGSLRALWPWKENYDANLGPLVNRSLADLPEGAGGILPVLAMALLGGLLVMGAVLLERRLVAARKGGGESR